MHFFRLIPNLSRLAVFDFYDLGKNPVGSLLKMSVHVISLPRS